MRSAVAGIGPPLEAQYGAGSRGICILEHRSRLPLWISSTTMSLIGLDGLPRIGSALRYPNLPEIDQGPSLAPQSAGT